MPPIVSSHIANMMQNQAARPIQQTSQTLNVKDQTQAPELLQALKNQKETEFGHLYHNFFEASKDAKQANLDPKTMAQVFGALSPQDALFLAQSLNRTYGYHTEAESSWQPPTSSSQSDTPTNLNRPPLYPQVESLTKKQDILASYTMAKNQQAKIAQQSISQMQDQTQNLIANMLGSSSGTHNKIDQLGPNACFEEVLMQVMMKIAKQEEKNIAERIRTVERGHAGLPGLLSDQARNLGGVAGGAIGGAVGGYFSGTTGATTGATVGQDIGERLVGSYTGYHSQESRQIQFEKLKYQMHSLTEMMSAISNVLATIHQTKKNTISNIRG